MGVALIALASTASAQRGAVLSVPPQELARIWDAEHVSPPLTPLVEQMQVVMPETVAVT